MGVMRLGGPSRCLSKYWRSRRGTLHRLTLFHGLLKGFVINFDRMELKEMLEKLGRFGGSALDIDNVYCSTLAE